MSSFIATGNLTQELLKFGFDLRFFLGSFAIRFFVRYLLF